MGPRSAVVGIRGRIARSPRAATLAVLAIVVALVATAVGFTISHHSRPDHGSRRSTATTRTTTVDLGIVPSSTTDRPLVNAVTSTAPSGSTTSVVGTSEPGTTTTTTVPDLGPWSDEVDGVSCASATSCVAVGSSVSVRHSQYYRTLAETWNGSTWRSVPAVNPAARDDRLFGVTCRTPVWCVAVGTHAEADFAGQTLIEHWDGVSWSVVASPTPGAFGYLGSVSCPSPTMCMAVGVIAASGSAGGHGLIETWDGVAWSVASAPDNAEGTVLDSISCASPTACMAVGWTSQPARTFAETWDGAAWTVVPTVDPGLAAGSRGTALLSSVSCATASSCIAVGDITTSTSAPPRPLAEQWNGHAWNDLGAVFGAVSGRLMAVSCPTVDSCTAVGQPNGPSPTTAALVGRDIRGTWHLVDGPGPGTANTLASVSCTPLTTCVAVGSYRGGDSLLHRLLVVLPE